MTPHEAVRSILGPMTSQEKCRRVVEAVLKAIREPTLSMAEAADDAEQAYEPGVDDWTLWARQHVAMIDAAISDLDGPSRSQPSGVLALQDSTGLDAETSAVGKRVHGPWGVWAYEIVAIDGDVAWLRSGRGHIEAAVADLRAAPEQSEHVQART
jgi:hypothetical protein